MVDLGTLAINAYAGNSQSQGLAINSSGVVVGDDPAGTTGQIDATIWQPGAGGTYTLNDLNNLIPERYGMDATRADAINDAGLIVVEGMQGGTRHALLLTPQTQHPGPGGPGGRRDAYLVRPARSIRRPRPPPRRFGFVARRALRAGTWGTARARPDHQSNRRKAGRPPDLRLRPGGPRGAPVPLKTAVNGGTVCADVGGFRGRLDDRSAIPRNSPSSTAQAPPLSATHSTSSAAAPPTIS